MSLKRGVTGHCPRRADILSALGVQCSQEPESDEGHPKRTGCPRAFPWAVTAGRCPDAPPITTGRPFLYARGSLPCYCLSMALDATTRRRWLGALVLLAALGMLIGGETVLKGKLQNLAFILYWLVCFVFTGLAMLIAFLDARALQIKIRQEERDLFARTLKQIETEAKAKPRRPSRSRGRS